jgi:hypothetical protein
VEAEILQDMITYLGDEVGEANEPLLLILINRAIRKVCAKRYPFGYTVKEKESAVEKYRDTIFEAAVYYWAKQGADGEASHSENGISRNYQKEDDIYFDVVPMVKAF